MEKKLLNDQELENIGGGRKWRDSEQKDYKATAGKFMDYYNALMKAGRYEEARELVSIYTVHSVLYTIKSAKQQMISKIFCSAK